MVIACSVKSCTNKQSINNNLSFHKFPKNPKLLEQWLSILRTKNWKPKKNSKICSGHFLKCDFYPNMGHSRLRETAVPSQNLPYLLTNHTSPQNSASVDKVESIISPDTSSIAVTPESSLKDKNDIESTELVVNAVNVITDECISDAMRINSNTIDFNNSLPTIKNSNAVECTSRDTAKCITSSQDRIKMLKEKNTFLRKLINNFINIQTNDATNTTEQDLEKLRLWSTKVYKRNLYLEKKLSRLENKRKECTENTIVIPVNYDHHYAATPQSLKRRLLNYEERFHKQRKLLSSCNRQLHRSMVKQSELRNMIKEMEKRKDVGNDNTTRE